MAYNLKTQEKFVELRGQGLSFEKISKELNVSKPTLIKWQSELHVEIGNEEAAQYQALLELHRVSKRQRIEAYSKLLSKVMDEIGSRSLEKETTRDLLALKSQCEQSLLRELNGMVFYGEYLITGEDDLGFSRKHIPFE